MALTKEAQEKWEKSLKEFELWEEGEVIEDHTGGDFWDLWGQHRGNYIFTNKKLVFMGWTCFAINYSDIKEIKKCVVGMIIPTGIKVTAYNSKKGKNKKYKLSVLKRKSWIEYLAAKAGISPNV